MVNPREETGWSTVVTATLIIAQLSLHITEISLQTFPSPLPSTSHHFADPFSDLTVSFFLSPQ